MAQIKCPNCGTVRVVPEGKRKNCRKCGTALTTNPPKPAKVETVTAEQLKEKYPQQIKQIIAEAAKSAEDEPADEINDKIGLEAMSWNELKKLAKEKGLEVPVVISKINLIAMITESQIPKPDATVNDETAAKIENSQ